MSSVTSDIRHSLLTRFIIGIKDGDYTQATRAVGCNNSDRHKRVLLVTIVSFLEINFCAIDDWIPRLRVSLSSILRISNIRVVVEHLHE